MDHNEKEQKRETGTLKDVKDTVIYSDEDGSIRDTITYINAEEN